MIFPAHTLALTLVTMKERQIARGCEAMGTSVRGAFDRGLLGGLTGEIVLHEDETTRRCQVAGANLGRAMREVLTAVGLWEAC